MDDSGRFWGDNVRLGPPPPPPPHSPPPPFRHLHLFSAPLAAAFATTIHRLRRHHLHHRLATTFTTAFAATIAAATITTAFASHHLPRARLARR